MGDDDVDRNRPLVLAEDTDLLDDLLRLAAAAGCELHRVADAVALRRDWGTAPLVLLDPAGVARCAAAVPPRRPGVLVVCAGEPPPQLWPHAVAVGAERVVSLPRDEEWLVAALTDAVETPGPGRGRVLALLGGRGGAGASTLAAAVAVTAARRGDRTLLVDCDPLGGGLDLALGLETADGLRWPELALGSGRVAASSLRAALPATECGDTPLTVLSCDRSGRAPAPDAVAAVVDSARRAGETVVCDLPRHLPEFALVALDRADLVLLVVPADVRSCAAASVTATRLAERGARLGLVVRLPAPGGLTPGDVSRALGCPVLACVRDDPAVGKVLDHGRLPGRRGTLSRVARRVLDALAGTAARQQVGASPGGRSPVGAGRAG